MLVQARGAWVTRSVSNWVKAMPLQKIMPKLDWHIAAMERKVLSLSISEHGNVVEQIVAASEEQRKQNRDLLKKYVRSLYFLVMYHIPHTSTFEPLISLQIENGDVRLQAHRNTCPRNATYQSYTTVVELLSSISEILKENILSSFQASKYYSIMADESTDSASQEEYQSVLDGFMKVRWLNTFLELFMLKGTTAELISDHPLSLLTSV